MHKPHLHGVDLADAVRVSMEANMTEANEGSVLLDMKGCARCHGDGHAAMRFRKLHMPMEAAPGVAWTHWAICPTTGEPILYRSVPDHAPDGSQVFACRI